MDWDSVEVIDQESNKTFRLLREAVWIRRSNSVNGDEGSYQLIHSSLLTDA